MILQWGEDEGFDGLSVRNVVLFGSYGWLLPVGGWLLWAVARSWMLLVGVGFVQGCRTKETLAFLFDFKMMHRNIHAKAL